MVTEREAKRRRSGVPSGPADAAAGEYNFAAKAGPYMEREAWLQSQEAKGEIAFEYVVNDGSDQALMWLVGLKNIYSRQLPNMPKEYITRLVLDRRHRSVALVRCSTKQTIGGITYRPFQEQRFAEIAFCAITATEQVRGYGTRLMNQTKEAAAKRDGCTRFLTYADNSAVGYFAKQGFTKEITLPKDVWGGFIKDYDGGTLMECVVSPERMVHTDIPETVRRQKAALWSKLTEMSSLHVVHNAPSQFLRAREEYEQACASGRKQFEAAGRLFTPPRFTAPPLDPSDVPGLPDVAVASRASPEGAQSAGYVIVGAALGEKRDVYPTPTHLHTLMRAAWEEMSQHRDAWPFLAPVDANEVTGRWNGPGAARMYRGGVGQSRSSFFLRKLRLGQRPREGNASWGTSVLDSCAPTGARLLHGD